MTELPHSPGDGIRKEHIGAPADGVERQHALRGARAPTHGTPDPLPPPKQTTSAPAKAAGAGESPTDSEGTGSGEREVVRWGSEWPAFAQLWTPADSGVYPIPQEGAR